MFTIRKKLFATEGSNPNQRYNEELDTIETTYDGGLTWTPTPLQDPRSSPAFMTPETAVECDAGQGYSNFIREFIDGTYDAFNIVGISSWAINIGVFAGFVLNPFAALAILIAEGVISIGAITLAATFTEDVYDQLRCIFYCHLDENGHIPDQATFDLIGEDIQNKISDGNVNIVMALMFNLYGFVGFTNAAIRLQEGSDCEECDCTVVWGYTWDFSVSDGDMVYDAEIAYTAGHWNGTEYAPDLTGHGCSDTGNYYDLGRKSVDFDLPMDCEITLMRMNLSVQGGLACNHAEMWVGASRSVGLASGRMQIYTVGATSNPLEVTGVISGETGDHVGFGINSVGGADVVYAVSLEGTGTMPDFTGGTPYTP